MGGHTFRGNTKDAEAPFLGAEFWKDGVSIAGVVVREFDTKNGKSYVIDLLRPVTVDGIECESVSVGNMAGFRMAVQAAVAGGLKAKDEIVLKCVGHTVSKKEGNSPRADFDIEITRPQL